MIKDKSIFIKNIYYMLTYAFHVLKQKNYEEIEVEKFDNIENLFSAILTKAVAQQLKQGLHREYVSSQKEDSVLRGKIDISETIKVKLRNKNTLVYEEDELSVNNIFNQIIKKTMNLLKSQPSVEDKYKSKLKKELLLFAEVDDINVFNINWKTLKFHKNNQSYKMLLNICYLVLNGLLYSDEKGKYKVASFIDEQSMCRLYEKFILEYYVYHYKNKLNVNSSRINWDVDDGFIEYLPKMQSDIMLKSKEKTLIIDAKYYTNSMQKNRFDTLTIHTGNLYQIFAYVKNEDKNKDGSVSGMLLYAKTDEQITPDFQYSMSGNKISAKSLDLNQEFSKISAQLNQIVFDYFNI